MGVVDAAHLLEPVPVLETAAGGLHQPVVHDQSLQHLVFVDREQVRQRRQPGLDR